MSDSSQIDINKVAKLATLPITPEEKAKYEDQLAEILKYVEQIEAVNTNDVQASFNVSKGTKDTHQQMDNKLTQDEVLKNTSSSKDGYAVTKGVFESE